MVRLLNNHQHIYLFDDILSDVQCEYLQKVIDKYSNYEEKHGWQSNVQSKTVALEDLPYEKIGRWVIQLLTKITKDIFSKYEIGMSKISYMVESPILRKITGATRLHVDGLIIDHLVDMENKTLHLDQFRELSMIVALNDDYDGGEFCFPDQNFELKLKKGQILLFPPFWTHPHKTKELKNDTVRYTITTWLTCDHDYK